MKRTILLVMLIALFAACSVAERNPLLGSWSVAVGFYSVTYTFTRDMRFTEEGTDGSGLPFYYAGDYEYTDTEIVLYYDWDVPIYCDYNFYDDGKGLRISNIDTGATLFLTKD